MYIFIVLSGSYILKIDGKICLLFNKIYIWLGTETTGLHPTHPQ